MTTGALDPPLTGAVIRAERDRLIADRSIGGSELSHRLAEVADGWVATLVEEARAAKARSPRIALLAVGGYGRGELAPFSDLDVLLVHETTATRVEPVAAAIWYPLWDAGLRLGHGVRTFVEQERLARQDLDTATALLTARFVAGDHKLGAQVTELGRSVFRRRRKRWLGELRERVQERQRTAGEVAYMLEPDLKDGHGGLRDAQSLRWAAAAGLSVPAADLASIEAAYDVLLEARVALHRSTGRPGEVLRIDDQDAVAAMSRFADADELMAEIAAAARHIAWVADEAWSRVGKKSGGSPDPVAPGVMVIDGEVELEPGAHPSKDPTLVLTAALAAARRGVRIGRTTLDTLTEQVTTWPEPWPFGAADDVVALLLEGRRAIPVLEALDQRGLLSRLLPEWEPVRSRPQRNAYHRFTVDRHLWEAAANASELVDRVGRPDLLVLGALFHDLGKGYPGDHTDAGIELVREIAPRMGLPDHDVGVLEAMVRHHLLLPDVAVRRDLTDPDTISQVANAVGTVEVLELLHALTEADSLATGPSAWNSWKEELVADLVERVRHVLGGGDVAEATWRLFPDAEALATMARGEIAVRADGDRVIIVNPDRPGTFSRLAGVLSIHGLDVVSAQAHSDEARADHPAMAASQFRIADPIEAAAWAPVVEDLHRALRSGLAIEARLQDRARTYRRRRPMQAAPPAPPKVTFHDRASSNATVLEVRCPTSIGILYRITRALAEVGLDIRHSTVQTIGVDVVDTFYVRAPDGGLVTDPEHRREIERAVLHAVS